MCANLWDLLLFAMLVMYCIKNISCVRAFGVKFVVRGESPGCRLFGRVRVFAGFDNLAVSQHDNS